MVILQQNEGEPSIEWGAHVLVALTSATIYAAVSDERLYDSCRQMGAGAEYQFAGGPRGLNVGSRGRDRTSSAIINQVNRTATRLKIISMFSRFH